MVHSPPYSEYQLLSHLWTRPLHSVTPNFNNWSIAAKLGSFYPVPFLSTGIFRVIEINWVADGKKTQARFVRLPTDAVTMFDVIYERLLKKSSTASQGRLMVRRVVATSAV